MKLSRIACVLMMVAFLVLLSGIYPSQVGEERPLAYDSASEVQTRGVIQDVQEFACPLSGGMGSHLLLHTDSGVVTVHLATAELVRQYQPEWARGTEVQVLGSRIRYQGGDTLIAREITVGGETFIFRNSRGKPLWEH